MPQRKWNQYTAVKKYPMLKEYLERFNTTSFYNEVPGLISFFYLQGQALVDHVRIPVWASALDPRIHVFWIQATRSGKTIAWEFTGEVAKLAGLNIDMFTSGTDSAGQLTRSAMAKVDTKPWRRKDCSVARSV